MMAVRRDRSLATWVDSGPDARVVTEALKALRKKNQEIDLRERAASVQKSVVALLKKEML
jgi:hypothetical protein